MWLDSWADCSVALWCYNSVTSVGSEQPGLETWACSCGCMGEGGPDSKVTLTAALPERNWYHMHTVISGEQTIPAEQPLAEGSLYAPTRHMDSVTKSKSTNRRQWELHSRVLTAGSWGRKVQSEVERRTSGYFVFYKVQILQNDNVLFFYVTWTLKNKHISQEMLSFIVQFL